VKFTREYLHHRWGYRFGSRCYWVRIYEGKPGDAPVVVCSPPTEVGGADEASEASRYLAAEVVREFFADGLPDLPRPLLWIEHRPGRRRRSTGRYYLLSFATYHPKTEGLGFVKCVTLGAPEREPLTPEEVSVLTGEEGSRPGR
jgi:hypothetical protein